FFRGCEKFTPTKVVGDAVAIVAAIRDAVGYEIDLGVEIHRNLRPEEAVILAHELLPFRMLYYEDPLAPESVEAMEYVAQRIHLPIATGERFYNIYQFKELIDRKTVSLIRSDPSLAGGFTQCKKIAGMAEAAFVGVFPHLMGSPLNISAFVQFDASIPNYVLMESYTSSDIFNDIVDHPPLRDGGYIVVPDRPGLGAQIDESKLAQYPYKPKRIPGVYGADGSVAH
ncbi:MAG: galactokinase, partial [Caldilineaceae bacterium]|nr:galactokinase [Caldilineaceae bacterium]